MASLCDSNHVLLLLWVAHWKSRDAYWNTTVVLCMNKLFEFCSLYWRQQDELQTFNSWRSELLRWWYHGNNTEKVHVSKCIWHRGESVMTNVFSTQCILTDYTQEVWGSTEEEDTNKWMNANGNVQLICAPNPCKWSLWIKGENSSTLTSVMSGVYEIYRSVTAPLGCVTTPDLGDSLWQKNKTFSF